MELVQDLVWTASVALILSFFVAKLVAIATTDRDPAPPSSELRVSRSVEEVLIRSQRKVGFVGEVKEVNRFEVEPAVEEVVEPKKEEESAAAKVQEISDDGGEAAVEEEVSGVVDSQRGGHEAQIISEEMGESATNDVVFSDDNGGKGKSEAIETEATKLGSYSDEDDWEGIEKSELDDGYVKSEGG